MIVRYNPGLREKLVRANWMFENHDSDWDGVPNRLDESPLGVPRTMGFRGTSYRGSDFDPAFYGGRMIRERRFR